MQPTPPLPSLLLFLRSYSTLLEATMDHEPTVWPIEWGELLEFCNTSGYRCRLEPAGSLLIPPDYNVSRGLGNALFLLPLPVLLPLPLLLLPLLLRLAAALRLATVRRLAGAALADPMLDPALLVCPAPAVPQHCGALTLPAACYSAWRRWAPLTGRRA